MDGRVYFCSPCDSRHEGEALWEGWADKELHWGIDKLNKERRIKGQLRNRLCWMLSQETGQANLLLVDFQEAVRLSGLTAREVLDRLRRFEVKNGRHRGRPRLWPDNQSGNRARQQRFYDRWERRGKPNGNKTAVHKG